MKKVELQQLKFSNFTNIKNLERYFFIYLNLVDVFARFYANVWINDINLLAGY
jgi:hypothetical protein